MKIAYFDCFSGASGDMILGALVDAGLPFAALERELAKLKLHGYVLRKKTVQKHHVSGTKVEVKLTHHEHVHRHLPDILAIIKKSDLSSSVKEKAATIFIRLAKCEGKIHGVPYDHVHFHEVGAVDAIVDIVGAAIGLELLGIENVYVSPLASGTGTITAAHGVLPNPAPATVELTKGFPLRRTGVNAELTTPTGAAILTTLAGQYAPAPLFTATHIGYGAGSRDLPELPNLLRLEIGNTTGASHSTDSLIIETNLDDMNPQIYGYLMDKLLAENAQDVCLTPTIMKKGRPGILLSVLADPQDLARLAGCIFRETTTIGIRYYPVSRIKLERRLVTWKSKLGLLQLKEARLDGTVKQVVPEYDDCVKIARRKGMPLREVMKQVEREFGN
jgi:uncharacterized protein (TIGR00299 family) protein